jgi:Cdc6-like AAA superfamily ATPase
MSSRPSLIDFVNCKSERPRLIQSDESRPARLLVLDEIESLGNFREILMNCRKYRCSIIGISNAHDETLVIAKSGRSDAMSIVFESYTPDELVQIMVERIGGLNDKITCDALLFLAKTIGKDHGDAREVLSALNFVVTEAVRRGFERIDLAATRQFLDLRTAPAADGRRVLGSMSLIDQFALVAICNAGKKWLSCLQRIIKQKHVSVTLNAVDIFERLESYGFVGQTRASPKCFLEKKQLADELDPVAAAFL